MQPADLAKKMAISSFSGAVAETVTFPIDLTKTRMMTATVDPKACRKTKPTMFSTFRLTIAQDGVLGLWTGISPAVSRHMIYTGLRVTLYEVFRNQCQRESSGTVASWKCASCGFFAGIIGQFIASPFDLIKVRMQTQTFDLVKSDFVYKSLWHGLSSVYKDGGTRALWLGCIPNLQRAALVNLTELATYDKSKHFVRQLGVENPTVIQGVASICSSLMAAVTCTPADLIKSRMMNQPTINGHGLLYSGAFDCLVKTVSKEGLFTMWRGFFPVWIRMLPWSLTFWLTYEQSRKVVGLREF
eukprot:m.184543 g.184543  ORF g.184543 m.184543 type:complete len:300 (+) comp14715_c0_seq4:321-1220(+)